MIIEKSINVEYFWIENSKDLYILDTDESGKLINKYVYKNYVNESVYNGLDLDEKLKIFKSGRYKIIYNDEEIKPFESIPILSINMI